MVDHVSEARLDQIWRYPVKSLGGERVDSTPVTTGIPGDRLWAVRDRGTGAVVTAKREPRILYAWAAIGAEGGLVVGVPGLAAPVSGPAVDDALSAWLDRPVEVVEWAAATSADRFDYGFPLDLGAHSFGDCGDVLHLVGTASLRRFGRDASAGIDLAEAVRRSRPNLVLTTNRPYLEDAWVGRRLRVGEVELSVRAATTRCVMVDRAQPGFAARETLMDGLFGTRAGALGVYAEVTRPGALAPAPVEVLD